MFISMQFYMMTVYDEIWDGPLENYTFFATTEYGNKTISTYIPEEHFREVKENRADDVQLIWEQQCFAIIQQFGRNAASLQSHYGKMSSAISLALLYVFLKTMQLKNKPKKIGFDTR